MSTQRRLPRVAVVHDLGSATPGDILAAAHRLCRPLFVADFGGPRLAGKQAELTAYGEVLDVTGVGPEQRLALLKEAGVEAVVTYSEYQLRETARLAAGLGLPGHTEELVSVLVDKLRQRGVLADAGVDAVRIAPIGDDPRAALDHVGTPAVIKPRVGAGSLHTVRVDTPERFLAVAAALPEGHEFVAEELLEGDPRVAGPGWGDYVSVESVHTAAGSRQVCVTGKFPLAEPFRESGMLLPATLDADTTDAVLALDAAATRALGLRCGITHTEIKLTAAGPRLIEVNGRLGGYVPEILKRATGVNLVRAALEAALGREPRLPEPRYQGVTYQYFLSPPPVTGTLTGVDGAEELRALPGVRAVELDAPPGRFVDYRDGTQSHLGVVYGSAPDHESLQATGRAIAAAFTPRIDTTAAPGAVPDAAGSAPANASYAPTGTSR